MFLRPSCISASHIVNLERTHARARTHARTHKIFFSLKHPHACHHILSQLNHWLMTSLTAHDVSRNYIIVLLLSPSSPFPSLSLPDASEDWMVALEPTDALSTLVCTDWPFPRHIHLLSALTFTYSKTVDISPRNGRQTACMCAAMQSEGQGKDRKMKMAIWPN